MLTSSAAVARISSSHYKKARLLIVSDETKPSNYLQSELKLSEMEITRATSTEEIKRACYSGHDLVVVDVAPGKVVDVLEALRGSEGCKDISVLVDTTRLVGDQSLAGVLPAYRAMPCNSSELVKLARRATTPVNNKLKYEDSFRRVL